MSARAGLLQADANTVPELPRASRSGEAFGVTVERTRVANGGWEYHLCVGGARVEWNSDGVGIFTGPEVGPVEMLPRLLRKVSGLR